MTDNTRDALNTMMIVREGFMRVGRTMKNAFSQPPEMVRPFGLGISYIIFEVRLFQGGVVYAVKPFHVQDCDIEDGQWGVTVNRISIGKLVYCNLAVADLEED